MPTRRFPRPEDLSPEVIVEVAAATPHFNSFNTISRGMTLDASQRDIVAAGMRPEASRPA